MHKLVEISKMLNNYRDGKVMFDAPVLAILPNREFRIHGVHKSEEHGIWLLEGSGEWYGPLLATQLNGEILINAIHSRLKLIEEPPIAAL